MLRTNLSTRPFYNDRAVKSALVGLALVALGLTAFNIYESLRLRAQTGDARETIARNDDQARELRAKAAEIRRSIDAAQLKRVQVAAGEANALIDQRTFSWTALLNQFETTLPADVRIGGVTPQVDESGRRLVQIAVISRRIEDLEVFMDALEKTGLFSGVLSRSDSPLEDGTIQSVLQGYYLPIADGAAVAAAPASESGEGAPGNNSAPARAPGNSSAPANAGPRGPQ